MSSRWIVLWTIVAWLIGARAQAEQTNPALHWSRAETAADCVDPRTLAELVETYTGPVLVAPGAADFSIEGEIERSGPEEFRMRVSVTVTRGRPAGQRVLTMRAADCRKLDGAIAFVIATTLNPDLGVGNLPPELSWLQSSELPPGEELRHELAKTPPPEPRPSLQPSAAGTSPKVNPDTAAPVDAEVDEPQSRAWELGVAFAAGKGRVPTANAGGLLTAARLFGSWFALTLQLRGNASLGGFDVAYDRAIGVETFDGALLACGRVGNARALGFQTCLGPNAGWFQAHGTGFTASHTVVQPLYGGMLKLELRYEIADKLAFTAGGLLDVGFRRPLVEYEVLEYRLLAFRSHLYSLQGAVGLTRSF
jgi:hypothetical protein